MTTDEEKERQAYIAKATGAFKVIEEKQDLEATNLPEVPSIKLTGDLPLKSMVDELVESIGGSMTLENVRGLITQECRGLEALLHEKNAAYGNSALDPVRIFSKASPVEQLLVRIDDKLSRITRGDFAKVSEEDLKTVTKDLLGYLILLRVAWRLDIK